ncbi:MAG: hypothetical protein IT559_03190 [Alphaproteobacteria bacterium]|nr:hypothetical protein [Alphaproteobacteria bacterium]
MLDFGALGLNKMKDAPPPPEGAALATMFMKSLKESPDTLDQVLARAAKEAGVENKALDQNALDKIADKLAESLDALVRDEWKTDADGKPVLDSENQKQRVQVSLDSGVKAQFKGLVSDSKATSVQELAQTLRSFDNSSPSKEKEDLFLFLHRGGNDFAIVYTEDEVAMLRGFLNTLSPGLGDTVVGFIEAFTGPSTQQSTSSEAKTSLQNGYRAMTGGNASLERFWKPEQKAGPDGKPLSLNPLGSVQQPDLDDYFNGTGAFRFGYNFYGTPGAGEQPDFANRGFEETILNKWEKEGTVSFASPSSRADFIQFTKQTLRGGALEESFLATLQGQGKEGLLAFSTTQAQADFVDFTQGLSVRNLGEIDLANKIMEYVERDQRIDFKPLDPGFDKNVYTPGTRNAIIAALRPYYPVANEKEFVARIEQFAKDHPGVGLGDGRPSAPAARASASAPVAAPPSISSPVSPPDPPVVTAAPIKGPAIEYSSGRVQVDAATLSNLGLREVFAVNGMDKDGNLTKLADMNPQELLDTLGGEMNAQIVMHEGFPMGYFLSDPAGQGVYVAPEGVDRAAMSPEIRDKLTSDYDETSPSLRTSLSGPLAAPSL